MDVTTSYPVKDNEEHESRTDTVFFLSSITGHHSALLQLRPGTHHVKFIIDGEMQLSNDLETAADFTNILVNYIEVSADDIPKDGSHKGKAGEVPAGVYPPQVLPTGTEAKDHAPDSVGKAQHAETETKAEPVYWGKEVPPYLLDIEKPEHTNRYQRAAKAVNEFPTPPGLPLFLGKSILNGTTPMKDDASVLNMPNHTVLNHLATSSIKNEVLATSITTRYIRKVSSLFKLPSVFPLMLTFHAVCYHHCLQTHGGRRLNAHQCRVETLVFAYLSILEVLTPLSLASTTNLRKIILSLDTGSGVLKLNEPHAPGIALWNHIVIP